MAEFDPDAYLAKEVAPAFDPDAYLAKTDPTPKETPEDQSIFRQFADVPVGVGMGAARGVRGITDVFGANNPVSQSIRGVEEYLDGLLSAQAKENQQEVGRIMQEAEDKGVGEQVKAALKGFMAAPVDLMSQALGTAAPNIIGGLGAGALKLGAAGVRATTGATGAAMGAGIAKGEIYEAVKEEVKEAGLSDEQAEEIAQRAQSYGGGNLDQIALAGVLGLVAARTGIERAIIPGLTGKISKKLAKKGFGNFTQTVSGEALTEAAQGGQERLAQNVALQREGFDVPTFRGVPGASMLEGVTGGGVGAGVGAVTGSPTERGDAPQEPPTRTEAELQALREEQKSAEYMREVEQEELAEQQRQAELRQIETAEQTQQKANELAERAADLDFGVDALETSLDSLYAVKDDLTLLRDNVDRSKPNAEVRKDLSQKLKAVNTRIKEGQDLAKSAGLEPVRRARLAKEAVANLPPDQRAKAAAAVFEAATPEQGILRAVGEPQIAETETTPTVSTRLSRQELLDAGLPQNAAYVKQLSGLDLSVQADRTAAAEIIGRAVENPRVAQETKDKIQALYQQKLATPTAPEQTAIDFDAEPATTEPTAAPAITQESFDAMGIGKNAVIRKNDDLLSADLSDSEQVNFVRNALETYRDAPNRSEGIVEKVNTFLDTLPTAPEPTVDQAPAVEPTPAPEVTPDVAPTPTPAPVVEPAVESTSVGQPSEPSVGVADVGTGPTPAPTGTPRAPATTTDRGLGTPADGAPRDVSRAAAPQPTVAPDTTQQLIEDDLTDLSRKDDLDIDDVVAAAVNAQLEGRISSEDAQMVAESETAQEALTFLEIAVESGRSDIVRAVDTARAAGDAAGAVTPALTQAIKSLDPRASLRAIIDDDTGAFTDEERAVARNIANRSDPLPTMRLVDSLGVDANGDPILGQYNSVTDEVSLVRGTEDSHTLLHELIHSFVHRTIILQERSGAVKVEFKILQDVYNYVKAQRPDLANVYGMDSLTEFSAEAMSNREFQMQLMGMPYPQQQSVFSWFARTIRKLFGLSDTSREGNVLFTSMVAVDGLMRSGRDIQLNTQGTSLGEWTIARVVQAVSTPPGKPLPTTFAEVNQSPNPAFRSEGRKFINTVTNAQIPLMDIFRQQAVDMLAPIASKINAAFSQGVRSAFGDVNPMVWMRQAYDHDRVALQVFRRGGLRTDKDGMWEAFDLKDSDGNSISPEGIIGKIQALAEKEGMSYAQANARVSTLLESMRLSDFRNNNEKIEALAREKFKSGDLEGAFETRQEKTPLHKTNAEIDADVAIFDSMPEVQEIQKDMNTIRSSMIDAMVKSGRLSAEQGATWKSIANYVPFDRIKDIMVNPEIMNVPGRRGMAVLGKIPVLKGSYERPVANTINNYMNKLAWMTEQTMRNSAVVRTLDYMVEAGMARRINTRTEAAKDAFVLPEPVYKDGKPVLYELQNQYDLAAFVQTPEIDSTVIKAMGGASRLLRTTITATPMFAIKQVIDDSQRVVFNSGVKRPLAALGKTLYYFPRVWWSQAFGKDFGYMRQMEALGIAGDFDFNPVNPVSILELDAGAVQRSPIRALIHRMEQVAKASDMAARLAVYEQTMQESGDSLVAQQRARELINFNRRGASKSMRAITHVVPFFNSYVQGMDLMYRGFTGADSPTGLEASKARRMFLSRVGIMAGLSTIYAMSMSDDEYYEELTDDVRDRHWILPKQFSDMMGVEQPFKITVPNEFGYLFKSIPERAVQYMKESQAGEAQSAGKVFMDGIKAIAGEYGFMPIPAAFKPLIENTVNYSTFTKRELLSPTMKARPAPLQYTSSTSELGKALGKATNQSPILIDNFIRGYFGMAGGAISVVADSLLNPSRPGRGPEQIPFLSIGLVAPVGTRTKNEFYEFREKVTEAVSGLNTLKTDNPNAVDAFVRKNAAYLEAAPYINNYLQYLKRIRATKKAYETAPDMTSEEKRQAILELQRAEQELLKDFRQLRSTVMNKQK